MDIAFLKKLPFKFGPSTPKEIFSLGVDIGSVSIKVVKLRLFEEKAEVVDFKIEPFALDSAPVLKNIFQAMQAKKINLSISGPSSIIRYVDFPKMNAEELKQAMKFEAQKHIPFTISEVNLDCHVLKENPAENKMRVLLAAVKKDLVSQRLKLAQEAGVAVNLIDNDSLAMVNAFNFNYAANAQEEQKTIALLNIGALNSNLNILEGSAPSFSRDIHIAGNNLTQKIADLLGLDFKAAEVQKINPDADKKDKIIMAIDSVFSRLVNEIRTSVDYYETQSASSVAKIFLSGGSSHLTGIKEKLATLLGTEVELWDPFKQISIAGSLDAENIKKLSGQLGVAVGLALRK
ncbi:MAG: type IV pilus assembly protein PilM [Candidatus Omnitrophica bacterium]|nr:type IV pilus assembly protein PilM [Candidatus Omnitrophota bacterium]MDD5653448.1 type IV pilus assembly protein PilM [Candidatus Omnitrophota bacterium]